MLKYFHKVLNNSASLLQNLITVSLKDSFLPDSSAEFKSWYLLIETCDCIYLPEASVVTPTLLHC